MNFQLQLEPSRNGGDISEKVPIILNGVKNVTFRDGYCQVEIIDKRTFPISHFNLIKNTETGEVFVENGKWVFEKEKST